MLFSDLRYDGWRRCVILAHGNAPDAAAFFNVPCTNHTAANAYCGGVVVAVVLPVVNTVAGGYTGESQYCTVTVSQQSQRKTSLAIS
jgi:hypothetical protein